ncbi:hypothetical protein PCE1_001874 [Barthelona sp. PCE]
MSRQEFLIETKLKRWLHKANSNRSVQPTFEKKSQSSEDFAFVLAIQTLSNIKVPPALAKTIDGDYLDLVLSLRATLFHTPTQTFFGNTHTSPQFVVDDMHIQTRSDEVNAYEHMFLAMAIEYPLFFHTDLHQDDIAIVVEIVMGSEDRGVIKNEMSCGFFHVVFDQTPKSTSSYFIRYEKDEHFLTYDRLPVYTGSPRLLLFRDIAKIAVDDSSSIFSHLSLHPYINPVKHMVAPNFLFSPADCIAGISETDCDCEQEEDLDLFLLPRYDWIFPTTEDTPMEATLLRNIRVNQLDAPQQGDTINMLCKQFRCDVPDETALLLGVSTLGNTFAEKPSNPVIVSRRLVILNHNGHTFVDNPRMCHLQVGSSGRLKLKEKAFKCGIFPYHPMSMLIFMLQYGVRFSTAENEEEDSMVINVAMSVVSTQTLFSEKSATEKYTVIPLRFSSNSDGAPVVVWNGTKDLYANIELRMSCDLASMHQHSPEVTESINATPMRVVDEPIRHQDTPKSTLRTLKTPKEVAKHTPHAKTIVQKQNTPHVVMTGASVQKTRSLQLTRSERAELKLETCGPVKKVDTFYNTTSLPFLDYLPDEIVKKHSEEAFVRREIAVKLQRLSKLPRGTTSFFFYIKLYGFEEIVTPLLRLEDEEIFFKDGNVVSRGVLLTFSYDARNFTTHFEEEGIYFESVNFKRYLETQPVELLMFDGNTCFPISKFSLLLGTQSSTMMLAAPFGELVVDYTMTNYEPFIPRFKPRSIRIPKKCMYNLNSNLVEAQATLITLNEAFSIEDAVKNALIQKHTLDCRIRPVGQAPERFNIVVTNTEREWGLFLVHLPKSEYYHIKCISDVYFMDEDERIAVLYLEALETLAIEFSVCIVKDFSLPRVKKSLSCIEGIDADTIINGRFLMSRRPEFDSSMFNDSQIEIRDYRSGELVSNIDIRLSPRAPIVNSTEIAYSKTGAMFGLDIDEYTQHNESGFSIVPERPSVLSEDGKQLQFPMKEKDTLVCLPSQELFPFTSMRIKSVHNHLQLLTLPPNTIRDIYLKIELTQTPTGPVDIVCNSKSIQFSKSRINLSSTRGEAECTISVGTTPTVAVVHMVQNGNVIGSTVLSVTIFF